jgi:hypothetical protein
VEKTYWFKVYLWWNRRAVVEDSNKLEREETRGLTPLTFHPKQKKEKKKKKGRENLEFIALVRSRRTYQKVGRGIKGTQVHDFDNLFSVQQ